MLIRKLGFAKFKPAKGTLPSPAERAGDNTPAHLAMDRFRALLVKGLNLTAQPLQMEYEKEILRLAIFCKLFWD